MKVTMRMPSKKFLFILFFIPSTISFLKLFKITITSQSFSTFSPSPTLPSSCSHMNLTIPKHFSHASHKISRYSASHEEGNLTDKEHRLLLNHISQKVPCNILFFGLTPQFLSLAKLNFQGNTIFLEDDEGKLKNVIQEAKRVKIYKAQYHKKARDAYELLKHGREHFGCKLKASPLHESNCKLALKGLPEEVYEKKWDVVVVDGPQGDWPEAPGRMGTIYTAAVIARNTANATDVFVHDVDRMVEKWYSWEFLCHENLVSSKGHLWHFRVEGNSRSSTFCKGHV